MDLEFYKKYQHIMLEDDYIKADEFKDSQIPNCLYKYFPCDESRINAFINEKLWLAQYDTFNDENEFSFMQISRNNFENAKLISSKWTILKKFINNYILNVNYNQAIEFFERAKRTISISCFTTDPMNSYFWKEYSNHENGFCIEYQIDRKDILYPVIYTNLKVDIGELLYNTIVEIRYTSMEEDELYQKTGQNHNVISNDLMHYLSILYFNYCCKTEKWSEENEYRIVYANPAVQTQPGQLVKYSDLGIKPTRIYIGKECEEEFKNILENAGKSKSCDVFL